MTTATGRVRAFGVSLDAKIAIPGAWSCDDGAGDRVEVVGAPADAVRAAWSGDGTEGWSAYPDRTLFRALHGVGGDLLFEVGDRAVMHLDAGSRRLSVSDADDVWAQRALLDSVLFTLSLRAGFEALHAGAVHTDRGVLAVVSGTGGGKSTLIAELVHRGSSLMTDDVLALSRGDGVMAWPGPPLMTIPDAVPHEPGTLVHELAEERWVAVPVHDRPARLGAVVILDRVPGPQAPRLEPLGSPFDLLPHLIPYPDSSERAVSRFEAAADVFAAGVAWRLTIDREAPANVAAAALDDLVAGP